MGTATTAALAIGAAGAIWIGVAAQQEMLPRPGPGSGRVDVNVINRPAVEASQSGDWRVALVEPADVRIVNQPQVTMAGPAFMQAGRKYRVTWADGQTESVAVAAVQGAGWVQVETTGRDRWLNAAVAREIEALN